MKKSGRIIISSLLSAILLISLMTPAFAAVKENVKPYSNMLVLGDSIVCADELPTVRSFAPAVNSYSYDLAELLGLETYNSLALQGGRIVDELYLLGAAPRNYRSMGSEQYITRMLGKGFWDNFLNVASGNDPLVGNPKERVKEADLIIIQIANNDICGYPFVMSGIEKAVADGNTAQAIPGLIKLMNEGLADFYLYYPKLLRTIRSLNKNADLVLVGNYNPFDSVSLDILGDPEVGKLVSTGVKTMNAQVKLWAKQYGGVYVDTFELSDSFPSKVLNNSFSIGPIHPSIEGHRWIARQILSALPATEKKLILPIQGSVRLTSGGIDGGIFTLSKHGMFWNISDADSGESISVSNGRIVRGSDNKGVWLYIGGFCCFSGVTRNTAFGLKYLTFEKSYLGVNEDGLTLSRSRTDIDMYLR